MIYRIFYAIKNRLHPQPNALEARATFRLNNLTNITPLSSEENNCIDAYYAKYGFNKVSHVFHAFYKNVVGEFDVRFLPETIYYRHIDRFYNNWDMAKHLDNKTFYQWYFKDVRQPETIGKRMNGFWMDCSGNITELEKILSAIDCEGCFCKVANESYGGAGVRFCKSADEVLRFVSATNKDLIIQLPVAQHDVLAKISPSSINTVRLISLLKNNGQVKIYSTILRMGVGNSKVDNATSGGITIGIDETGRLNDYAYSVQGVKFEKHPTSGFVFSGTVIPGIDKARKLIERQAPKMPHFRLISWDIAIDPDGEPILIEANLCDGELDFHQINNGPIFGDDTDEVMQEITGQI